MILQGGCLCGAVRYQCKDRAALQFNCHCRDCQKSTGGPFAPIAFFPTESVTISGEVRYFQSRAGSGKIIRRGFCPSCGSQLFGVVEILPGLISVRAGTLDDPSLFRPRANLFTRHAVCWSPLDAGLIAYPDNAPSGG